MKQIFGNNFGIRPQPDAGRVWNPAFRRSACRSSLKAELQAGTGRHTLYLALTLGLLLAGVGAGHSSTMNTNKTELATLGGGCFWCLEACFELIPGVKAVTSGYSDGPKDNPTYKEVCGGDTGHAEVVQIEFDPAVVSYEKLLETFWQIHDPTTLNRQGNDTGTQYRSIILYHNDAQQAAAEKSRAGAQRELSKPIVTQIVLLKKFWPAEAYHQDYFRNNPDQGYCQTVVRPKVEKVEKKLEAENK
jgi:peptide-methionine (S)-S-oxide reductase